MVKKKGTVFQTVKSKFLLKKLHLLGFCCQFQRNMMLTIMRQTTLDNLLKYYDQSVPLLLLWGKGLEM